MALILLTRTCVIFVFLTVIQGCSLCLDSLCGKVRGQSGHSKISSIISHTFYLWLDAPWHYLCLRCQQPVYFGVVRTMSVIWQKKTCSNIFFALLWRFRLQNTFVLSFIFYFVWKWIIHLKDFELTMTDQYALYTYTSALDLT